MAALVPNRNLVSEKDSPLRCNDAVMIYLLKPDHTLHCADIPQSILGALVEHNADYDLSKLDWTPSERSVTDVTVRLALREGQAVKDGILMDAGPIILESRPDELTRLHIDSEQLHDRLEQTGSRKTAEDMLESQAPGWRASGARTRVAAVEVADIAISRAQIELDAALARPVKADVLTHWTALGGVAPEEAAR